MESKSFKKGQVLFREGSSSDEMYYVESGSIAILIKNEKKVHVPISILKKGDFLGEFAFFSDDKRSATAMVLENTSLKVIDKKTMSSIGKNGLFIVQALIKKIKRMNEAAISDEAA